MDEYAESDSNKIFEGYKTSEFSGMRETGRVEDYAVAEYEDRGLRLKYIEN